jgi:biotin operon repressor
MATSYEYWDNVCAKVKELRDQGMTILQIEEETGYDYEDVLWAINQETLLDAMRSAT